MPPREQFLALLRMKPSGYYYLFIIIYPVVDDMVHPAKIDTGLAADVFPKSCNIDHFQRVIRTIIHEGR